MTRNTDKDRHGTALNHCAVPFSFGLLQDIPLFAYFESKGYQVINIGVDVTPEAFEKAVRKYHPQVLAMSASLTTTLPSMQKCMEHLEKKGLRKNMRIIVGGAPVTKQFAHQLNADFYADNAKEALQWLLENFII